MPRESNDKYNRELIEKKDYMTFIRAWETSSSVAEVIRKMGQEDTPDQRQYNSQLASRLRRDHGYALKSMRGSPKIDQGEAIGYSVWLQHQIKIGVSDGRRLTEKVFRASPNYNHYTEYGSYRQMQMESGVRWDEIADFREWMRESGRADEETMSEEEFTKLKEQMTEASAVLPSG